jgi:hypothetical protein
LSHDPLDVLDSLLKQFHRPDVFAVLDRTVDPSRTILCDDLGLGHGSPNADERHGSRSGEPHSSSIVFLHPRVIDAQVVALVGNQF